MGFHKKSKEPFLIPKADFYFNFFLDRVNVDWQSINAVDIDLLMRQVDVRALQEHIRDVTFCCLDGVQCQQCLTPVDPTFVKLFRLAQLSLQWLDYCQKMIVFNMNTMEKKLKKSDTECKKLQAKSKEQEQKMKQMVSELKARRNIIQKQQSMFAKDMSSSVQCQHCDKKYINGFFLQEHMLRRHPSQCQNLTHQIGQKDSEIESLKLEISSLRTQMAQTAEEQNQRLQQEVWKVQQGKMQLHTEKETLQLEKSKMQMETENLQKENLRLKTENEKQLQEILDLRTENGKLERENLDLRTENGQLEQENLDLRTENGELEQENLDLKTKDRELRWENSDLRTKTKKLQQENLSLLPKREKLNEDRPSLQVENMNMWQVRLQQENLQLASENKKVNSEYKVQSRSLNPPHTHMELSEPFNDTPKSAEPNNQNKNPTSKRASLVLDEQFEQEAKVRRKTHRKKKAEKAEMVSGGEDVRLTSPQSTSASEVPAPSISEARQESINSKGGKKRSKLSFGDSCKAFHSLWPRLLTLKHAP